MERTAEISQQADAANKKKIQEQSGEVSQQWNSLVSGLESRRDTLTKLAQLWEDFESKWQSFESQLTTYEERAKHIDLIVRSKQHVVDTKATVEVSRISLINLFSPPFSNFNIYFHSMTTI